MVQINRYRRGILLLSILFPLLFMPLLLVPTAYADGGAPNLAYISGTAHGISTIDVAQQKVTQTISVASQSRAILLNVDARFLYITEPEKGQVAVVAAKTGETFCTANVAGQPSLLALDATTGTLYAAGNGAASVIAIDPSDCSIKHVFQTDGNVYGVAIAAVGSSIGGNTGDQLWVAANVLQAFDTLTFQQISSVPIPGGPQYVSIPAGATIYITTHDGTVVAVDLSSHTVIPLVSGGTYGPMDYDATTGEVYVPDEKNDQLVVLAPVNAGFTPLHEPSRILHLGVAPQSIAITSDGQLGFAALQGGNVVMIDVPGKQVVNTIFVGGNPQFVITGLYPPVLGTTPQQASVYSTVLNIVAYIFVIGLFIVPIVLFHRYAKVANANKNTPDNEKEDNDAEEA